MKHVIDQLIPEINKMVLGNLYTTSVSNLPTCEEEEEEEDEEDEEPPIDEQSDADNRDMEEQE